MGGVYPLLLSSTLNSIVPVANSSEGPSTQLVLGLPSAPLPPISFPDSPVDSLMISLKKESTVVKPLYQKGKCWDTASIPYVNPIFSTEYMIT